MAETGLVDRLRHKARISLEEYAVWQSGYEPIFEEAADALATKEAECVAYVKAVDEWVDRYTENGSPPTKDAPHGRLDWLLTTMNGIAVQRLERLRALEAECGELRRALLEAEITKATPSSQATFGGATPDPWYDPYMKSLDRISALQLVADAMWQLLDDMGAKGTSVCLAAKAQARIAYEPFRNEDSPLDWPLEEAQKIWREANQG